MSDVSDLGLDLDDLFQPAWAKGKAEANRFEKFTGEEGVKPERKRGERRGPRPEGGPRREDRPHGGKKFGGKRNARRGDFPKTPKPQNPKTPFNIIACQLLHY